MKSLKVWDLTCRCRGSAPRPPLSLAWCAPGDCRRAPRRGKTTSLKIWDSGFTVRGWRFRDL